MARFKSITHRWITGNLGIIIIILLFIEVGFAFGVRIFFYNTARQILVSQANTVNALLGKYAEDPSLDYRREVRNLIENFEARSRMELMAVDENGHVLATSSGFEVVQLIEMPDFHEALSSPNGIGEFRGRLGDENVLAITVLSPVVEDSVAAARLVVSLSRIDRNIFVIVLSAAAFGLLIVFFMVLSGSYFISSIVLPVTDIGKTALKIAGGDFATRLEKKNDDEIGALCETINNMAEELAASERMKNEFISSVSHELRTPLTAIKGWSETILDSRDDPDTIERGMKVIIGETDRLALMVEELLDFSRMQSGRFKLSMEKIDPLAELEEAVMMYTEKARREKIELVYEEMISSATVMADRNRLRQVFINVIDNAIKYSDPGGRVLVSVNEEGDWVVVTVQDEGCGIKYEDLPNIKQKFYKGSMSRRGSGIGLAVADEIITAFMGTLDITSSAQAGTCATIAIPTARAFEAFSSQTKRKPRTGSEGERIEQQMS
jgi:signal transduction histidine kinase